MALAAIRDSDLSAISKRSYLNTLSLVGKAAHFNPESLASTRKALNDVDKTYAAITARWPTYTTRGKILTALLSAVRHSGLKLAGNALSRYKHIHHVLMRNNFRRQGRLSTREQTNWVSHKEFLDAQKALFASEPGSQRTLLISWLSLWPPNRADQDNVIIYNTEADVPPHLRKWMYAEPPTLGNGTISAEKLHRNLTIRAPLEGGAMSTTTTRDPSMPMQNFLVLRPSTLRKWRGTGPMPPDFHAWDRAPRLVLLDHKTAGTHGRILRALPIALQEVLAASLAENPRDFLFVTPRGAPFASTNAFTKWAEREMEQVFDGRRPGFNGARHSYISAVDMQRSTAQQLATLARDMGHSTFTQRNYVRRPDTEITSGREAVMLGSGKRRRSNIPS